MAKLNVSNAEGFGKFIVKMLEDPALRRAFEADPKSYLREFSEPRNRSWDEVTVKIHFDTASTINVLMPYIGDVQETLNEIAPQGAVVGSDYGYPDYCTPGRPAYVDPSAGADTDERKRMRLKAYHHRIADYIMTRCK